MANHNGWFFGHLTYQSPFQKQLLQQQPGGLRKEYSSHKHLILHSYIYYMHNNGVWGGGQLFTHEEWKRKGEEGRGGGFPWKKSRMQELDHPHPWFDRFDRFDSEFKLICIIKI